MKINRVLSVILVLVMVLSLCACVPTETEAPDGEETITVTDMVGRKVTVTPGSYKRVVCIGAGALRMYSYIGDAALLAGVDMRKGHTIHSPGHAS